MVDKAPTEGTEDEVMPTPTRCCSNGSASALATLPETNTRGEVTAPEQNGLWQTSPAANDSINYPRRAQ